MADDTANYRVLAAQGDGAAMTWLGLRYLDGEGVPVDERQALRWFRKAARKGDVDGMFHFADCNARGVGTDSDAAVALQWYERAADGGSYEAMERLGDAHANGVGLPKDAQAALSWYRKAAEGNNASAMAAVARCHQDGRGVPQSDERAVEWFRKAAKAGDGQSMYALADAYMEGRGVARNVGTAATWYAKADEAGVAGATTMRGWCYENGVGVPKSWNDAARCYRRAADNGSPSGLGACYEHGLGVRQNLAQALEQYKTAAARGSLYAQHALNRLNAAAATPLQTAVTPSPAGSTGVSTASTTATTTATAARAPGGLSAASVNAQLAAAAAMRPPATSAAQPGAGPGPATAGGAADDWPALPPTIAVRPPVGNSAPAPARSARHPDPAAWTVDDVCSWLSELDMGHLQGPFRENRIRGAALLGLQPQDYPTVGLSVLGDRVVFDVEMAKLRSAKLQPSPNPAVYALPPPAYDAVPVVGASVGTIPMLLNAASAAQRVAVLRRNEDAGHLITVPGDLASLKQAAGAKLGIVVASLWLRGRFEVTDVLALKDLDELVALTRAEDQDARSAAVRKRRGGA